MTAPPQVPPGPDIADLCAGYAAPTSTGTIANPMIREASGIAASRRHPGVLWAHNDSGDAPMVYALGVDGSDLGAYAVDALAFDWEDIAIGPGPDPSVDYLYVGDIGDNLGIRRKVTIYRFPEPEPGRGGTVADVVRLDLSYPVPGLDAESLIVDPITGDVLIVTKSETDPEALVMRAAAEDLSATGAAPMTEVGIFRLEPNVFVTGADIDATGTVIAFRGYNEVWLWSRSDLRFETTFSASPCAAPSPDEIQGEAIAFEPNGFGYYTVSEGRSPAINHVATP